MTLGQEFGGYAACIERGADDVERASEAIEGTESRCDRGRHRAQRGRRLHGARDRESSSALTGIDVGPAANRFRVTQSMGDVLAYSGAMRRLAVELSKIASDLRLLSSGPRAGLGEIVLPAVQPGLVDHAGQGESVGARDGESGVLSRCTAATRRSARPPRPGNSN